MSEGVDPQAPTDDTTTDRAPIRSRTDRIYGLPRASQLAFGAPQPLIAYAVPFVVVTAVAAVIAMTALADQLILANNRVQPLHGGPAVLTGAGIVALAALVAHAFGITAASLVLLARADGRTLSVRDAWNGTLRRPGSLALAFVVSVLATVVTVGISTILLPLAPLLGAAAVAVLVTIVAVAAPLLLAWPLVLGGRKPLGPALAWAWRSNREIVSPTAEPFRSPRVAILATIVLTGVVVAGLTALGGLLPVGWWTPVVGVALAIAPTAVVQVLFAAVTVRGVALRDEEPLAPIVSADPVPTSATTRGGPSWGVAVLLVPAIVAGLLMATNPWGTTSYSVADVPTVWRSSEITPWADGSLVVSRLGGESSGVRLCSGATCGPENDLPSILPTAVDGTPDGGVLSASWYPIEGADSRQGSFEFRTTYSSPEALREWAKPLPSGLTDEERREAARTRIGLPGDERTLRSIDSTFRPATGVFDRSNAVLMAAAVDASGENPVIASVARPLQSADASLAIDFCSDAHCTASERTVTDLTWGSATSSAASLDVTMAPDGRTAIVTLSDSVKVEGGTPLRVFTATAGGEATSVTLDDAVPGPTVDDYDNSFGARVEIGNDGLPVILSRPESHTTLRLFTCADLACESSSITDIEQEIELLSMPTLAIDATGRPLIGTFSTSAASLLSCDDAECSTLTLVELADVVPGENLSVHGFALGLDAEDRPLVAVGFQRVGSPGKATDDGTVFTCTAPRCNAD